MGSGEGKCCVDTNIREEWGVEKGSVVWTLTSRRSGEWRRDVRVVWTLTSRRSQWGVEKGSVVWTLTSGSSGEWRREVLCGH